MASTEEKLDSILAAYRTCQKATYLPAATDHDLENAHVAFWEVVAPLAEEADNNPGPPYPKRR